MSVSQVHSVNLRRKLHLTSCGVPYIARITPSSLFTQRPCFFQNFRYDRIRSKLHTSYRCLPDHTLVNTQHKRIYATLRPGFHIFTDVDLERPPYLLEVQEQRNLLTLYTWQEKRAQNSFCFFLFRSFHTVLLCPHRPLPLFRGYPQVSSTVIPM